MHAEGEVVRLPERERAEEGPPDFALVFADEHRQLFKALYFVTGNRADAAELMQEDAFLKLWERNGGTRSIVSTAPPPTSSAWRSTDPGCVRAPHAEPRG
jgi:hypothetical protein